MHLRSEGKAVEQDKNLKDRARKLRKDATKEENLLWYNFLRTHKLQFRRQYIIGNYIVDFYCHVAKLVVELDGSQHCELGKIEYDRIRTE
jgi:very-short-patch-repair endonuclease